MPDAESAVLNDFVMTIFKRVLFYCLMHLPDGWKYIEDTISHVLLFAEQVCVCVCVFLLVQPHITGSYLGYFHFARNLPHAPRSLLF